MRAGLVAVDNDGYSSGVTDFTTDHLNRMPLFPLPSVVFFPHTLLPLHVFEPRYQEMVESCLANDWPICVPCIRPGHEGEQLASPPMCNIAGAGFIRRHEVLPDGRFNIVLGGIRRVRVLQELTGVESFRVAEVEVVEEPLGDPTEMEREIELMQACLIRLAQSVPTVGKVVVAQASQARNPAQLADRIAALIFHGPRTRQAMLECAEVDERVRRVTRRLSTLVTGTLGKGEAVH